MSDLDEVRVWAEDLPLNALTFERARMAKECEYGARALAVLDEVYGRRAFR